MPMPQQSSLTRDLTPDFGSAARYAELPLQTRRLLWLTRLFIAARLDYARAARSFAALAPGHGRAVPILFCHLLLEISSQSARRLMVAGPCHTAITEDELRFLAVVDLAQRRDPRLSDLLARLCGLVEDDPGLAPVCSAARKLGEALLQEGLRIDACGLLPPEVLPAIH